MKPQTIAAFVAMAIAPVGALATPQPASEVRGGDQVSLGSAAQPGGTVHTVVKGDTLWDLSEKYLGSPWYWPKVWSYNPQIDNPHWIYPGNRVRFAPAGEAGRAEEMPTQITVEQPEAEEAGSEEDRRYLQDELVTVSSGKSIGMVPERGGSRIRQESFISPQEFQGAGKLERAFSERQMLSIYDKVYLRFDDPLAVRLGDVYSLFRLSDEIIHPVSGESFGHRVDIVGSVRVTALGTELITGIIESVSDEILRGDLVAPLGDFDKRLIRRPNESEIRGVVLASQNPLLPHFGEHHVVFIDKGAQDGVHEGNSFDVIRRDDPLRAQNEDEGASEGLPEETVGRIVVFDVKENASAGIVVRSLKELEVGEEVLMRAQTRSAKR
ncbi:MAG: LysM peptidoglycan-binding domain-containing protein [Myxococcaceae bacterium]|nr:LysM peptidoglycan-binding domain-containing protein [Myxococcaceae bacterium]